jgi:hypothetical protein
MGALVVRLPSAVSSYPSFTPQFPSRQLISRGAVSSSLQYNQRLSAGAGEDSVKDGDGKAVCYATCHNVNGAARAALLRDTVVAVLRGVVVQQSSAAAAADGSTADTANTTTAQLLLLLLLLPLQLVLQLASSLTMPRKDAASISLSRSYVDFIRLG